MCGLVGAWSLEGPLDPAALERACLDRLRHRGPDGAGWLDGAVAPLDPLSQVLAIELALRLPDRVVDAPKAPLRARARADAGARERLVHLAVLHLWHRDWYRAAPPAARAGPADPSGLSTAS